MVLLTATLLPGSSREMDDRRQTSTLLQMVAETQFTRLRSRQRLILYACYRMHSLD